MQLNSETQPRKCVSEFKALNLDPKFFVSLYRTCGVHSKLTYAQIVLTNPCFHSWFSNASLRFVLFLTHKKLLSPHNVSGCKLVIVA